MFRGKNFLPGVLAGLLFLSALTAALFTYLFIQANRDLRNLQAQAAFMQNRVSLAQSLANDCLEYSKRNPAIDPILQTVGLKARPAAAAPAKNPKSP